MAKGGNPRISITADASGVKKGVADADRALDRFGRSGTKSFGKLDKASGKLGVNLKSVVKAAAGAAVAYAGIGAAKSAVNVTLDLASSTTRLHKSLGLSVHSASQLAAVAQSRDVDLKAFGQSLAVIAKNADLATHGGDKQAEAFRRLGITQKELKDHSRDFEGLLPKVAEGFKTMGAGQGRTAVASQLLGRSWQVLIPLLASGSKALKEQTALADKYGVTFGGKTIKSVKDLQAAQREAQFATMGLQLAFSTQLAPTLTKVVSKTANFVAEMRAGTGAGGRFADRAGAIWKQVKSVAEWVGRATSKVANFGSEHPGLTKVGVAFGLVAVATAKIAGPVTKLIKLYQALKIAAGGAALAQAAGGGVAGKAGKAGLLSRLALNPLVAIPALAVGGVMAEKGQRKADRDSFKADKEAAGLRQLAGGAREAAGATERLAREYDRLGAKNNWQIGTRMAADLRKINAPAVAVNGAIRRMSKDASGDMASLSASVRMNTRLINRSLGHDTVEGRKAMGDNFNAAAAAVRNAMDAGTISTRKGLALIDSYMRKSLAQYGITGGKATDYLKDRGKEGLPPSSPAGRAEGGLVTRPGYFAGEESPLHPEIILASNPAYRKRNLGLWAKAGNMLGVPGFATGGVGTGGTPSIQRAMMASGLGNVTAIGQAGLDRVRAAAAAKLLRSGSVEGVGGGGTPVGGTLAKAGHVAKLFGLHITSGYRSPSHNAAVGGVANSLHTHGSASNPGAIDEVGPVGNMMRALAYVKSRYRMAEAMVHDAGSGLHLHMGFFKKGGIFKSTAYGPPWDAMNGTGVTRTGVNLKGSPRKYGVAVDPKRIALGSMLNIWPNPFGYRGAFKAFDTGGAIKGNRLDFYDWRGRARQLGWGRRNVRVEMAGATGKGKSPSGGTTPGYTLTTGGGVPTSGAGPSGGGGSVYNEGYGPGGLLAGEGAEPDTSAADAAAQAQADLAAAVEANTQALKALKDEQSKARESMERVVNSEYATLARALVAVVSGGIGGKVGLGRQVPSFASGGSRY